MNPLFSLAVLSILFGAHPQEELPAVSLAREVERLAEKQTLWPGFDPLSIPLAIFDGKATLLFRHPDPPEGFLPLGAGQAEVLRQDGRHPSMTANSSADIGGTLTATILLDGLGSTRDLTSLAAVALHEAFHVYQGQHPGGWLAANETDLFAYPIDDPALATLRRLESEALRRALESTEASETECWARTALELRTKRFSAMDPAFVAYDRGTESNEGLARYVQTLAAGTPDETGSELVPPRGFSATEVRQRGYATGAALAFLLDRAQPGWQTDYEAGAWDSLDSALGVVLGAPGANESSACEFTAEETTLFERLGREDAAQVRDERSERKKAFDARPGWRVEILSAEAAPLWPQGFDPLNVLRLEGAVLHARFLRLGNESGELEVLDTSEADVEALTEEVGPHPLFQGVRRVIVAGLEEPEVETDGSRVTIHAAGFSASLEGARVERADRRLLIRL